MRLLIRVITNYRTPSNLPKGKAKLISQQTDKISQQSENWENRNGPDLVQAFPSQGTLMHHIFLHGILVNLQLKCSLILAPLIKNPCKCHK